MLVVPASSFSLLLFAQFVVSKPLTASSDNLSAPQTTVPDPAVTASIYQSSNVPSKASSSKDGSCSVASPVITDWRWAPAAPSEQYLSDADGTRVATITLTTGGRLESGTWVQETTETAITFPRPFSQPPDHYRWRNSEEDIHVFTTVFFPTVYPNSELTRAMSVFPEDVPVTDPKGTAWTLSSSMNNMFAISSYRSLYPNEQPLQDCSVMNFPMIIGQPPGALQVAALTLPSRTSGTTETTTEAPAATGAIQTSGPDAFAIAVKSKKLGAATVEPTSTIPGPISPATISTTTKVASKAQRDSSSYHGHLAASESNVVVTVGSDGPGSKTAFQPPLTNGGEDQQLPKSGSAQYSQQVASQPGLSGPEMGSTRASDGAKSSQPPTIDGNTIFHSSGLTGSSQKIPPVSVTNGHVLVDGHTLGMNETVTLGSGSVVTRVALKTNKDGETIYYGDTITTASLASSITTIAPIMPSATSNVQPTTDLYFTEKPSATGSNAAPRSLCLSACWTFWISVCISSAKLLG